VHKTSLKLTEKTRIEFFKNPFYKKRVLTFLTPVLFMGVFVNALGDVIYVRNWNRPDCFSAYM